MIPGEKNLSSPASSCDDSVSACWLATLFHACSSLSVVSSNTVAPRSVSSFRGTFSSNPCAVVRGTAPGSDAC